MNIKKKQGDLKMSIPIREKLKNIRETYGNREILNVYNTFIFDNIVERYRGFSITIANPNKEFGFNLPDKHIEIDVIPENNERMKYCKLPIRIYITRNGTRKTDEVKIKIICEDVKRETGSESLDVTTSLPVNENIMKEPKLLEDNLIDFYQLLDFYILGKSLKFAYEEEELV